MGNPRLPTAIKEMKGTLKKSRENSEEPRLRAVPIPAPPEHLGDLERRFWTRLGEMVGPMNVFTQSDTEGFEMMVRQRALYEVEMARDERDLKTILNLSKDIKAWFTTFGLTPQARSGLRQLAQEDTADEIKAFFGGFAN